jgi:outer membrane protein OmpA-like peptidoglycan-associated protein
MAMKYTAHPLFLAAGLTLAVLDAGCSSAAVAPPAQSARGPRLPDPGEDQEYEVNFPEEGGGATRYIRLTIGDDLSRDCGLVRAHFSFDSAEPLPQDKLALRDVSTCLNRPELLGTRIEIVGQADARGDAAYNVELGRKRAESVKRLLVLAGVADDRITTSSLGKSEAVGQDKGMYSYGFDRRVDVMIRSSAHRPR